MHSTQAWDPVTVFVASAPVLLWNSRPGKLKTALLVSAITPISFCLTQLFCISAEMHSTQAWDPVTVFVASAPVLLWNSS